MTDTILVTGASGQLGRLVIDALLASGKVAPGNIIATTRDTSKLDALAEKGVTVRAANFDDAANFCTSRIAAIMMSRGLPDCCTVP